MKTVISPEIDDIAHHIAILHLQLVEAEASLKAAQRAAAGVYEGMIGQDQNGDMFQIHSLDFSHKLIYASGKRQKKDGTFNQRVVMIGYSWELAPVKP